MRAEEWMRAARKRLRRAQRRLRGRPVPAPDGQARINRYGLWLSESDIASGRHREVVGGAWDEIGRLQFDFLMSRGLTPDSYLLDVGCGALRGGLLFVRQLEPGHYFGLDVNRSLIKAARTKELPEAGLSDKVPGKNLRVTDRFEADFGVEFDFAPAVSLFTHLPLNLIRLCLEQVADVMAPSRPFFATFFEAPEDTPLRQPVRQVATRTFSERDPYHYKASDLAWAAESSGAWTTHYVGDWGHPRGQQMIEFRKAAS
jgi:SAM-dependent methyltransferase